jgi:hypothetical protein
VNRLVGTPRLCGKGIKPTDHTPASSAEVKNDGAISPLPHMHSLLAA